MKQAYLLRDAMCRENPLDFLGKECILPNVLLNDTDACFSGKDVDFWAYVAAGVAQVVSELAS